jgi:hypothetical protein
VDGTGSGSCAMVGISGVEPLCSAARELISLLVLMEIDCEDGRWIILAQDRVRWWDLVLAVLNLPENQRSARPGMHKSQGPSCPDN